MCGCCRNLSTEHGGNLERFGVLADSTGNPFHDRQLWLVGEYVMKSELPERLVPIVESAFRRSPRSDEKSQGSAAAA
jgi:hypothetical protein